MPTTQKKPKTIRVVMTEAEAHAILRAVAEVNAAADRGQCSFEKSDRTAAMWVVNRMLVLLDPLVPGEG